MKALFLVAVSTGSLTLPPMSGATDPVQQLTYVPAYTGATSRGGYWAVGNQELGFKTVLTVVQASPATIEWMKTQTAYIWLRNIRPLPILRTLYADAANQAPIYEAKQALLMPSDTDGQIAWALMAITKKTAVTLGQMRTALALVAEINDQPLCTGPDRHPSADDSTRATLFPTFLKAQGWDAATIDAKDWTTEPNRWASLRQLHKIKPDEWTTMLMGDAS